MLLPSRVAKHSGGVPCLRCISGTYHSTEECFVCAAFLQPRASKNDFFPSPDASPHVMCKDMASEALHNEGSVAMAYATLPWHLHHCRPHPSFKRNLCSATRLNLASFVTTWMEPECEALMADSLNINYIDENEYPSTTCIQNQREPR